MRCPHKYFESRCSLTCIRVIFNGQRDSISTAVWRESGRSMCQLKQTARSLARSRALRSVHLINSVFARHSRVSFSASDPKHRFCAFTSRRAVIMWLRGYTHRYNLIDYSTISRHPKKSQLFVNLFNEPRFCRSRLFGMSSEDFTTDVRYLEGDRA